MIDLNSSSIFADRLNNLIESTPLIDNSETRIYLGCSVIGAECERAVQYEAIRALYPESREHIKNEFPHRVQRIFDRGNLLEDYAIKKLADHGFYMITSEPSGGQLSCSWLGGQLKGHLDGIIVHYNKEQDILKFPLLWEHKAINDSNFKKVIKDKTKRHYPKYYAQIQMYMNKHNLKACLMHYTNANTMEWHFELVEYRHEEFEKYLTRAERVINATHRGEMLPRSAPNSAHLVCKYCNYADVCWS